MGSAEKTPSAIQNGFLSIPEPGSVQVPGTWHCPQKTQRYTCKLASPAQLPSLKNKTEAVFTFSGELTGDMRHCCRQYTAFGAGEQEE